MSKNQLKLLDDNGLAGLPISSVRGRELICNGQRLVDFCGTNYLGFDFNSKLMKKGEEYARRWGAMCGWSRLEADPEIYTRLEARIAKFVGAPRVLLSHTITIANFSVMPALAGEGMIFVDQKLHTVVWEAARLARDHGAKVVKFRHQNMEDLEAKLREHANVHPKVIAVDGVYSISTEHAPLRELQALARLYNAWLYVDDAHGFGILGAEPSAANPYGAGGAGIVRHAGGDYQRTFYVSSFGKAFCTHSSFVTIPAEYEGNLPSQALSHIYSAPLSPHTIGTVEAALDLNESIGERERLRIRELVARFCTGIKNLGFAVENHARHPVIFVPIGELHELIPAAQHLKSAGVLAGLRAYPVVPENQCGVRFAVTSLHTAAQVDQALGSMAEVRELLKRKAA